MRRGCIACDNVKTGSDQLTICDLAAHPEKAPAWCPERKAGAAKPVVTWLLVGLFCVVAVGGYSIGHTAKEPAVETGTQLASQVTVLYPSTLTYAQQTALEKGTGLEGVDFIYVERQTGIDALTLMAIAAHESAWGSNYWATNYNNVMSWGISDSSPDRTRYSTKTMNVLIAAQGLKRLYLSPSAKYYGGSLTLWGMNKYYATDKSWADSVNTILKQLEALLSEEQRMKRWCNKVGLFTVPTTWDAETKRLGWAFYKMNNATAVAGR